MAESLKGRSEQISAAMFMTAAVGFLLTALLGEAGGEAAFFVLAYAAISELLMRPSRRVVRSTVMAPGAALAVRLPPLGGC